MNNDPSSYFSITRYVSESAEEPLDYMLLNSQIADSWSPITVAAAPTSPQEYSVSAGGDDTSDSSVMYSIEQECQQPPQPLQPLQLQHDNSSSTGSSGTGNDNKNQYQQEQDLSAPMGNAERMLVLQETQSTLLNLYVEQCVDTHSLVTLPLIDNVLRRAALESTDSRLQRHVAGPADDSFGIREMTVSPNQLLLDVVTAMAFQRIGMRERSREYIARARSMAQYFIDAEYNWESTLALFCLSKLCCSEGRGFEANTYVRIALEMAQNIAGTFAGARDNASESSKLLSTWSPVTLHRDRARMQHQQRLQATNRRKVMELFVVIKSMGVMQVFVNLLQRLEFYRLHGHIMVNHHLDAAQMSSWGRVTESVAYRKYGREDHHKWIHDHEFLMELGELPKSAEDIIVTALLMSYTWRAVASRYIVDDNERHEAYARLIARLKKLGAYLISERCPRHTNPDLTLHHNFAICVLTSEAYFRMGNTEAATMWTTCANEIFRDQRMNLWAPPMICPITLLVAAHMRTLDTSMLSMDVEVLDKLRYMYPALEISYQDLAQVLSGLLQNIPANS